MRSEGLAFRTLVGLAAVALAAGAAVAADPLLICDFNKDGLASLQGHGQQLLDGGTPELADLKVAGGDAPAGAFDRTGGGFDTAKRVYACDYKWGRIRVTYRPAGDRLAIDIEATNSLSRPVTHLAFTLMRLSFPQTPKGIEWEKRYFIAMNNPEDVPLIRADWDQNKFALCRDDAGPGLVTFGLQPIKDKPYGVVIGFGTDPIPPGGTRRATVSIRVGTNGTTEKTLTGDVSANFAKKHPSELNWPDRRPIGSAFLSTSVAGYKNNPRGWLMQPDIDTTTPAGRIVFQQKMMAYADSCIAHCKKLNAQGIIVWDLEGQEMPHATSYIADPRMLAQVAPEMNAFADEFMNKFKSAGLRVGLTIRPTKVTRADKGRPGWMQADVKNQVAEIDAKLTYAEKRWGCTLFYVDSNVDFVKDPNDGHVLGDPAMSAASFQTLAKHHPNCLLMPEHKDGQYWAYTAPYSEYRLGFLGTPAVIRDAYPKAFSVMQVVDGPDLKLPESVKTLTAAIQNGDVLLFRPWWDDPQTTDILSLYQLAASGGGVQ